MNNLFTRLYDFLHGHRVWLWMLLAISTLAMAWFACRLRFSEDITSFLPDDRQGRKAASAFKSLRIKDKIIVTVSAPNADADITPEQLAAAADAIAEGLRPAVDDGLLHGVASRIDAELFDSATDFIYEHLPVFCPEEELARLDSLTQPKALEQAVKRAYSTLASPAGIALREFITRDPLGLATPLLALFEQFNTTASYELYDDHLYTPDLETLLLFADPARGSSANADNERLISLIERVLAQTDAEFGTRSDYFCAAGVAVYNARQIKHDTSRTLTIALLIIIVVITLAFRDRRAIPLMLLPVAYGALFALAIIYFIQGTISTIAIGAGAAVLGIALSYSIHVLTHSNHIHDRRQVVAELAYPLTVGSFTTIGAFLGLLFTRSQLLHDFGLFSALTLTGTTLFSLIFLPHMLSEKAKPASSPLLQRIERMNAYRYDTNKWLVGGLLLLTLFCLFHYNDVRFDSDMTRLGYEPARFKRMEQRLDSLFGATDRQVYLVTSEADPDRACTAYVSTAKLLDSLAAEGLLQSHASAADFVVPRAEQERRLAYWNRFWTPERRQTVCNEIRDAALRNGFRADAFEPSFELLARPFDTFDVTGPAMTGNPLFGDWINRGENGPLFVSRITLDDTLKERVYKRLEEHPDLTILDRAYFTSRMADVVNDDFNTILLISSLLVFLALLVSYGRIELALLASLPMAISWVLILGMMALFNIEFNIVNILLSTFIFGLGDDFSIFIMDGLLSEYKNGRKLLAAHKTAIFFSAFTTIVGIGALVFARHPALQSISVISIVGMLAVVLVAYTVQPVLFRLLVSGQTRHGGFPYTLCALLNTLYAFLYFFIGCLLLQIYMLILHLLPVGKRRRKRWLHLALCRFARIFLATIFTTRTRRINLHGETFDDPAVIIANHQSFIDILLLLSLTPRIVMVTNHWVWHSPFFGRIVRAAGFHNTAEGYETLRETLRQELAAGYSVVIFPEGTRSKDCLMHRFHKGAFQLAADLQRDLIPVLIYGSGLISSKSQPFYIKRGDLTAYLLPRITPDDPRFPREVRLRAKAVHDYMNEAYEAMQRAAADNPYYLHAIVKNYLYKGPVLEWYIRIKLRLERCYLELEKVIPRRGRIVDLGCGYGQAAFLLALRSPHREILGIDYDAEKIALARHCLLCNDRIRFECADITRCELPPADAFILNDVLHYVSPKEQERLIAACAERLDDGGCLVIREGDAARSRNHRLTEQTERWSVRILRFNKSRGQLHFPTGEWLVATAERYGLTCESCESMRHTSNRRYIFRKGGRS